jgi:hypothetical protein
MTYGSMSYGGEAFMNITGFSPVVAYSFSRSLSTYAKLAQSQKKYTQGEYEIRDATLNAVNLGVQYIYGRYLLGVGAGQEQESAEESGSSFVDRSTNEARLDLGVKLPADLTLNAGYLQRVSSFDDKLLSGSSREDTFSQTSLGVSMETVKNLTLSLRYSMMQNVSDYTPAEYTKNLGTLSLSYRY